MENDFGDILVPKEKVLELVGGVKWLVERRMFPGYLLIHASLRAEVWHLIRTIARVRGLVGMDKSPAALSDSQIEEIRQRVGAVAL